MQCIAANLSMLNFNSNANWCHRFMTTEKLPVHSRTTAEQNLSNDWEEKVVSWLNGTMSLLGHAGEEKEKTVFGVRSKYYSTKAIPNNQIINMDEMPLTFDCPLNRSVENM